MTEPTKNKLNYISVIRGFAMLFVVVAHSFVPQIRGANPFFYTVFLWICDFSMPVFMTVSGYLFQYHYEKNIKKPSDFYFAKIRSFAIPYLSMSVLSYVLINAAFLIKPLASVLETAKYYKTGLLESVFQILTYEGHIVNHLWYLPTILIIILLSFTTKMFFYKLPGLIIGAALFFVSYYIKMPYVIFKVFSLFIFFCLGRRLKLIDHISSKKRLIIFLPLFLILSAVQRTGLLVDYYLLETINLLFIGFTGSITFFTISKFIVNKKAGSFLKWVGDNSFIIYVLHQPFIVSGVSGILLMFTRLPHAIISLVTCGTGIVLPYLIYLFIIKKSAVLRILFLGDFSRKGLSADS